MALLLDARDELFAALFVIVVQPVDLLLGHQFGLDELQTQSTGIRTRVKISSKISLYFIEIFEAENERYFTL